MIIAQTSCADLQSPKSEPVSKEEFMLDTICSISIYRMKDAKGAETDAANAEADAAIEEAFALCRNLEDVLSRTRADSDISKINAAAGEWVSVSDETVELIQKGLAYSELSEGGFDISVGGITELWDFHAAEGEAKLPNADALSKAAEHVGYKKIEVDAKGGRVRLTDPETKIDLGGIAKGYIGDRMTTVLEEAGVTSAIINLGGNVICLGGKSDEEDFVIGVEAPFSDRTDIIGKVAARDKTLVTSGVYERKIEVDGKIYHHILDTKTGLPAETDLTAVTLVADKGRSADIDALSTVCLIKGAADAMTLIEEIDGVEGVLILDSGEIKTTSGMELDSVK